MKKILKKIYKVWLYTVLITYPIALFGAITWLMFMWVVYHSSAAYPM